MLAHPNTLNIPHQHIHCKVCAAAGLGRQAHTHNTRGHKNDLAAQQVIAGGWPIIKPLGAVTTCPWLGNTVCTNPNCFNGQNGVVRFPHYGHSIKYCPCKWPEGWEIGGQLENMRYTGIDWNSVPAFPAQYQQPVPQHNPHCESLIDELTVEDIEEIGIQEEEDEWGKELEFTQDMEDFCEIVELEEQARLHDMSINSSDEVTEKRLQHPDKWIIQDDWTNGRYYFNIVTHTTSWTLPKGATLLRTGQ